MKTNSTSGKSRKGFSHYLSLAVATIVGILIGISFSHIYHSNKYQQHAVQSSLSSSVDMLQQQSALILQKSNFRPPLSSSSSVETGKPASTECLSLIAEHGAGNRSASSDRLKSRGEIPTFLNKVGLLGEGVEVGVRDGEFSQWVLSHWQGQKYHMVDPWLEQDKKIYNDVSNRNQEGHDELYNSVKSMMENRFPGRHEIHRDYSVAVAKKLLERTNNKPMFDFIYLDARHDYDGVKEDLEAWWPLLKPGGLYAGHDFVEDGENKAGLFGVQKAVKEFVDYYNKEVMSISEKNFHGGRKEPRQYVDGGWTTWYFFK